jgi:hypothetical protein
MRNEPTKDNIDTWPALLSYYHQLQANHKKWIFRGITKASCHLQTSLERALRDFGVDFSEAVKFEKSLMHEFRRKAQEYGLDLPPDKEAMTWLTLMQHYGTPTRLLDWTYSFFVAVYFAIERAESGVPSAVWCIDGDWCAEQYDAILSAIDQDGLQRLKEIDPYIRATATFERVIERKGEEPMLNVYPGNAFNLNDRLIIQQGFFLMPCDISHSFEENLDAVLDRDDCYREHFLKITIESDVQLRKDILTNLYRMNITRATLFPGLQGFAESLRTLIASPDVLINPHAGKWAV